MKCFDDYLKELKEGKISRRKFLARMSALGITATLSPLLLNKKACCVGRRH